MTTIAWDGQTLAADRRKLDGTGLRFEQRKILHGTNFVLAGAGVWHQILTVAKVIEDFSFHEILQRGLPEFDVDKNDNPMIIIDTSTRIDLGRATTVLAYRAEGHLWVPIEGPRTYHACGSGRDYALAAMACGKTAPEAVALAAMFDNSTGDGIDTWQAYTKTH